MDEIIIDCSGVKTPAEVWQRYLDAVQPESAQMFGRNLDAFWDAIEGGGPGWPGEVALVFNHSDQLRSMQIRSGNGSFFDALKHIAEKASVVKIEFR